MARKTRKVHKYRRRGKSLIASGKLNPIQWHKIPFGEIARALKDHAGLSVKEVKKVRHLKHQVCISYINTKGKICCSFFSYRIFESWQKAVERLIYACRSLKELYRLSRYIQYDLDYFPYPVEISDAIAFNLENRSSQLNAAIAQAA